MMATTFKIILGIFSLGALSLLFIMILGWTTGYEWASLSGPGPTWPATVGFAALYVMGLSGAALMVLIAIALMRGGLKLFRAQRHRP